MHTSNKTQTSNKRKRKAVIKFIKSIKYDILFAFEVIALIFGTIHCLFSKKRETSFFVALSTLMGSMLTLSGIKHINSKLKSRKYIDIISTEKKESSEKND